MKNMNEPIDYWAEDDFEDTVSAGIIACFESNIKNNNNVAGNDRLKDEHLKIVRSSGLYFPSNSRIVLYEQNNGNYYFDVKNDKLPKSGCIATRAELDETPGKYHGYCQIYYYRQVNDLGKNWHKRGPGISYEIFNIYMTNDCVEGERAFITVSNSGEIKACDKLMSDVRGYRPGVKVNMLSLASIQPHIISEREINAYFMLQYLSDRKYCWSITAQEKIAKVHLGCMNEEIKSLLYARSLPMTETGRKRPILHLVEAHKRRMKNGTDIDVTQFLRGTQTVEMAGTLFTVNPPKNIYPNITKPSQEKYYSAPNATLIMDDGVVL
jgi:hypothetical protein